MANVIAFLTSALFSACIAFIYAHRAEYQQVTSNYSQAMQNFNITFYKEWLSQAENYVGIDPMETMYTEFLSYYTIAIVVLGTLCALWIIVSTPYKYIQAVLCEKFILFQA